MQPLTLLTGLVLLTVCILLLRAQGSPVPDSREPAGLVAAPSLQPGLSCPSPRTLVSRHAPLSSGQAGSPVPASVPLCAARGGGVGRGQKRWVRRGQKRWVRRGQKRWVGRGQKRG